LVAAAVAAKVDLLQQSRDNDADVELEICQSFADFSYLLEDNPAVDALEVVYFAQRKDIYTLDPTK
jgi:hypothetical protein